MRGRCSHAIHKIIRNPPPNTHYLTSLLTNRNAVFVQRQEFGQDPNRPARRQVVLANVREAVYPNIEEGVDAELARRVSAHAAVVVLRRIEMANKLGNQQRYAGLISIPKELGTGPESHVAVDL